jgi:molybdopterin-guanine dinucleotide biosynthesis protein A
MSREMIEYLAEYNSEKDIIICRAAGFLQPLVGIYKKSTLQLIDSILSEDENHLKKKSNHLSLHALIEQANTNILDVTSLPFYSDKFFFNINTKEDYEKTKINFLTF